MDDFNSSDIEMDPPPVDRWAHLGAKSIEAMFESRFEDRVKTKKRMANLQDTAGAPSSVKSRALWMKRFEAYLTRSRGLSVDHVPTGDDIARFLESISDKLQPGYLGKPAISLHVFRQAVVDICDGLTFKRKEFRLPRHDRKRIDALLDALTKEGKLTTGTWRRRERVDFVLLRKMGQAWFSKNLIYGCRSWDIVISRMLPILLMFSTVSRVGEVGRTSGYTGDEYMRWEHIELVLEGNEPKIENMVAKITIAYQKFEKNIRNKDKEVIVKPLEGVQNNTVCPIKLLLIHALRTGHVAHTSIEALLRSLLLTPNRRVQWTNQLDPIAPAIVRQNFLDFTSPAGIHQVAKSVRAAGLLAGILTPLNTHDIRAGASRDVAKLPSGVIKGVADATVAKTLGHSHKTLYNGVTDSYVGGIATAFNALVAKNPQPDRFGPQVADQGYFRLEPVKSARIVEYCNNNNLDPSSSGDRRLAGRRIQEQDREQWVQEQEAVLRGDPGASALASRKRKDPTASSTIDHPVGPLAERSPNISAPSKKWGENKKKEKKPKRQKQTSNSAGPPVGSGSTIPESDDVQTGHFQSAPTTSPVVGKSRQVPEPDELIDPQLLAMDAQMRGLMLGAGVQEEALISSVTVDPVKASGLESIILGNVNDAATATTAATGQKMGAQEDPQWQFLEDYAEDQAIDDALDEVIAETAPLDSTAATPSNDPTSATTLPGEQFVDYFSRINVVRNTSLKHSLTKLDEVFPRHVGMGHSRDEPSLFLIPCPNAVLGCSYSHPNPERIAQHEISCTIRLADHQDRGGDSSEETQLFDCGRDGCTKQFKTEKYLQRHIKRSHDWVPKKCELPDCPKPDVLWDSGGKMQRHKQVDHDANWKPSKCIFPGCSSSHTFEKRHLYNMHLKNVHKLRGEEKAQYFPPTEADQGQDVPC